MSFVKVKVTVEKHSVWRFLVRLCGIIGGVFATSGKIKFHNILFKIIRNICTCIKKIKVLYARLFRYSDYLQCFEIIYIFLSINNTTKKIQNRNLDQQCLCKNDAMNQCKNSCTIILNAFLKLTVYIYEVNKIRKNKNKQA